MHTHTHSSCGESYCASLSETPGLRQLLRRHGRKQENIKHIHKQIIYIYIYIYMYIYIIDIIYFGMIIIITTDTITITRTQPTYNTHST